jgi:hypothetical protein
MTETHEATLPAPSPTAAPPSLDPTLAATQRAKACWDDVQASLAQYRCRLQPALDVRPAGADGSAALVTSTVVIVPQP